MNYSNLMNQLFRSYNEVDDGNHLDQFRRMIHNKNSKDNNNKIEKDDENPLNKFKKLNTRKKE
jgi:hypothetical protein